MKVSLAVYWVNAAWRESERVGATEIGREHLYLGLIGIGGSAARLLGSHGITLQSAREAVRAHRGEPNSTPATVTPPQELRELNDPALNWDPDTKQIAERLRRAPDTFALLVGLLQDQNLLVRELVAADGVLPNDLVDELREGAEDAYSATRVPADKGLLQAPASGLQMSRFVSVPPSRLMDVLSDPASLAWWAYDPDTSDVGEGGERATLPGRPPVSVRFHLSRETSGSGGHLRWIGEATSGAFAGQAVSYDDFVFSVAPGGTDMERTMGRRRLGRVPRLTGLFSDQVAAVAMPHSTAAIAYGAAVIEE